MTTPATTFAATASCVVELDHPVPDLELPASRGGGRYAHALVLVRLHEEPLGVVRVDLVDGRRPALEVAEAILGELGRELADHVRENRCAPVPDRASGLLEASPVRTSPCPGARRGADAAMPSVAAIVPTAGRPDDIGRCLARLAALDYPRLEIIVVDNRPADGATRRVVEDAAARDRRVRYVAEPRPGSSVARNRGAAETQAEIVAFTDDDVAVDALWLRWMVEPFVDDEQVQAVTGLVLAASYDTVEQQVFEEYAGFGKGFARRPYDMGANRPAGQLLYPYWGAPFGSGNSMAFRRRALVGIGGFDPALGAGSPALAGADIESFTQIVLGGGRLVYEPRAVVWHDHRRDPDALARQLFNYSVGSTAILTKWMLRDPRAVIAVGRAVRTVAGSVRAGSGRKAP
ncbi:MAG TPA: glycosyltransferase family 2 protein, partial [Solirubrobacteraceae bacterium]|nr:glycosyltransferase family 2 protein [Solirubrobacteraceae bacterium]